MTEITVTVSDVCDPADEAFVAARIHRFNEAAVGANDGRTLAAILREERTGTVVAGVVGWTWARSCGIDFLWVHEDRRGEGIGRSLLRGAEREAQRRGACVIRLDTYSFQAPDLYRREGYNVIAEIPDSPCPPHRRLFMQKEL